MIHAIQSITDCLNAIEAGSTLDTLRIQDGYLGGRILPPSAGKPSWRVQAFFQDEGVENSLLPDGMRRVVIPEGLARQLGITLKKSSPTTQTPTQAVAPTGKVPVDTIKIQRADGTVDECAFPHTFISWANANTALARWAETAPKGGAYSKCNFEIVWANGETYKGRFDLEGRHVNGASLNEHVRSFLGFMAGTYRPTHLSDQQWEQAQKRATDVRANALKMLATLDLGE